MYVTVGIMFVTENVSTIAKIIIINNNNRPDKNK